MTSRRILATALALVMSATLAAAQNADVPALIKLVETQPADMDKSAWKEKRREAARKLAQSKDKRAVPVLIKLAEAETFDIIGEIAIEGLGNLNDQAAVPVLQKIANDPAREKPQRDLAKKALGKLGAPTTPPKTGGTGTTGTGTTGTGETGTGTTGTGTTGTGTTGTGTVGTGETGTGTTGTGTGEVLGTGKLGGGTRGSDLISKPAQGLPEVPVFPDDTIAAWDRLTFALGTANLAYDTVRGQNASGEGRPSLDVDVGGAWARRVERERMAFGWDVGAHVLAGFVNPAGRAQNRISLVNLSGGAEARFYSGKIYGIGKAAVGSQILYINVKDDDDPTTDVNDTRMTADIQIALGAGYGRMLDVGGAIRVRRLARTLDAAKALGKPIDPATAKKLQLTWWALRRERSTYRALVATVAILRESGILLVEPDAGLTFEILNVLRDTQLFLRPSGLDIQVAFGEGYLRRPDDNMGQFPLAGQQGRVEQLLFQAGYGVQLADDTLEVSGTAYGRYRLFAPSGMNLDQPSPWAFGATARMRKFTYGEHGDPFGALDISATLMASDDDPIMQIDPDGDADLGLRLQGQLGFTYWLNQASGLRLAATMAADGGELFIGAQLSLTYGFLDATFSQ